MSSLYEKHKEILDNAVKAIHERKFYAQYPEHPKPYGEDAPQLGEQAFNNFLNSQYNELLQASPSGWVGEEESPYTQEKLGVKYPSFPVDELVLRSKQAYKQWRKVNPKERAGILIESLEHIKHRFFEIAHATMHTTGQSFMMSFQASGPHANDRALEAVALGYQELTRFPEKVQWEKPMGKFSIRMEKDYHAIPRGVGLVIGCSTFPVWNTVPGLFAGLVTGNTIIVKPHPKVILPIAIVVAEIQKVLKDNDYDPNIVQLAPDEPDNQITTHLAESYDVKMIDYTGSTAFGEYIESLEDKVVFTEKAGVNSVILDSVKNLNEVMQNLAFSVSLYSGQMCTAPQNFFIPETGIGEDGKEIPYKEVVEALRKNIEGLAGHPKMGAGTLGAIQNEKTIQRVSNANSLGGTMVLESKAVKNEEYEKARTCSPAIIEVDAEDKDAYSEELFGPILVVIKTKNTEESVKIAKDMAQQHGAITCAAYSTDEDTMAHIQEEMNEAYTPVSFNLTGFIWVNQHAAFSDFHVTGGNPAGNATFTDPNFINRRFVWVGNRKILE